jgi:hypothetical protein
MISDNEEIFSPELIGLKVLWILANLASQRQIGLRKIFTSPSPSSLSAFIQRVEELSCL